MIRKLAKKFVPDRLKRHIVIDRFLKSGMNFEDGLLTTHVAAFLNDPKFIHSYSLGKATGSWRGLDIHWRAYVACWAALKGKTIEGDFIECGVNLGGLSRTIVDYINFAQIPSKKFYLLDTYRGFPDEFRSVAVEHHLDNYVECYDAVVQTFREFPNVVIVRGQVPETLAQVPSQRVAYLSLDMNCAEPEIAAAEYFWDKMSPGAVIVLDDYAYDESYARQRNAFDEFTARKGVQVLALPTGQGLIFKA